MELNEQKKGEWNSLKGREKLKSAKTWKPKEGVLSNWR